MDEHESRLDDQQRYERDWIDSRRILLGFAALVGVLVMTALATFALTRDFSAAGELRLPPAPRLQAQPARDVVEFRRAQAAQLQGYRWIDRQRGVVQIPIERAMEIEVQRARAAQEVRP